MLYKYKKMCGLLLVLLLFLVGCQNAPTQAARVLRVANGADPVSFDPHAMDDQASRRPAIQMYEPLIRQNEELELVPALATEWSEVEDNLYEFKLRQGVKFHNGEEFTAHDVAYTLKRAIESPAIGHIVESIDPETIDIIDDYTIRVGTYDDFGPFFTHMAHSAVVMLNEKAVEEAGDDYGVSVVVGTGPFVFEEWVKDSKVTANRFEDYWGEAPAIDRIEFLTIADPSVRLIELESGSIDIAYDIAPNDRAAVEENEDLELISTPNLAVEYLGLSQNNDTPLKDVKVRQAIAHAVDVEAIIQTVYLGSGEPLSGPLSELVFGFNEDLEPIEYDIDKAKQLLKEAGYPDGGFSLSFYVGDNNPQRISVSQIIAEALAELGIDVQVSQLEWGAFLDATAKGEPDMFLLGWIAATADADLGLHAVFHSEYTGELGNRTYYANERVDELLDLGRYTTEQAERLAYYEEAQKIIQEEVPWVFLQGSQNVSAISKRVKGFKHHPTGRYILSTVSLEEE